MATQAELVMAPTVDTPGTVIYLCTEQRNYAFGRLAEGSQRAFHSRKVSMSGTEHIFLSGIHCWDQLGGLLGFLLTVAGAVEANKEGIAATNEERAKKGRPPLVPPAHPGVTIHGTENLAHILGACRNVVFRQKLKLMTLEQRLDPRAANPEDLAPDWQDSGIRVWKVPVRRARSSSPRKRRHSSIERGQEPSTADAPKASSMDPEVATFILENVMFGDEEGAPSWITVKLKNLKPTDKAVYVHNNVMRIYRGPYAESGAEVPNPDDPAYVLCSPSTEGSTADLAVLTNEPLPSASYGETSMSYIVKCHDRRGKFNAALPKKLGIPPQQFKRLIAGETLTAPDGTVVTPDMVLGEPIRGRGIIVADISSVDLLEPFLQRPEWSNAELMADIASMYWILGPGLAADAQIHKFMSAHPSIKHVLCSEDTSPNMIVHAGPAAIQSQLRCLDPDRYPLPHFSNELRMEMPALEGGAEVQPARVGSQLQLMPNLVYDTKPPVPFANLADSVSALAPEMHTLAREAHAQATDPAFLADLEDDEKDMPSRDAEITALGTGSSMPSKYRNVSATLVRVPGVGSYLLDCGEGTLGQLRRLYGHDSTVDILRDLKCIVVSHSHADHHLGVPSVIRAWYEQTLRDGSSAELAISCITRYRTLLEELSQVEDLGFHRLRFPNISGPSDTSSFKPNSQSYNERLVATRKDLADGAFGLDAIRRVYVHHCFRSCAVELTMTTGLRVAYSGDCRPSADFARRCRGAHLLIHECTFGDDMQALARQKKHSTLGEALGVAREMGARRTLLTHFSQRYVKSDGPAYERARYDDQVYLLATDFMSVKLGDFKKAACYVPVTSKLVEATAE
ncbi:hypothetical protein B0I35DRAFT_404626 [Stachybotrys elegans]|uniref:ribonuclease Z n=1 Tax=Stachybotrys elegans TaxID=80388 RepID=A0A8K0WX68_9HYPO|nr:hypothetical protein B0I35DRAFT_404626 [Stachybotrys elegans]